MVQPSHRWAPPHLGHEVDPAAGSIVNGIQLLEQDAGIGQGEVAVEKVVENITVGDIQDLWVLVEVSGQLRQRGRRGREKLGYALPLRSLSSPWTRVGPKAPPGDGGQCAHRAGIQTSLHVSKVGTKEYPMKKLQGIWGEDNPFSTARAVNPRQAHPHHTVLPAGASGCASAACPPPGRLGSQGRCSAMPWRSG